MNAVEKKEIGTQNLGDVRNIEVNLSSTSKKTINIACRDLVNFIGSIQERVDEPEVQSPAEVVYTTRKSPCGNGTATYVRYTLRVYQRKFTLAIHDMNITKIADFLKGSAARAQLMILP